MTWRKDGRLWVALHAAANPTSLEWSRFVNDTRMALPGPTGRVLIISYGGSPDSTQRKELADVVRQPVPTAVMTSSFFMRSIGPAFQFFNPQMKIVGINDDDAAFQFLQLDSEEQDKVRWVRRELESELDLGTVA